MKTSTLFSGMVMIFMISATFAPILFSHIYLNRFWSPKIKQMADNQEKFLIWDTEGGQTSLILLLLAIPPQLV